MQGGLEWVGGGEVETQMKSPTPAPVQLHLFALAPGGGPSNDADDHQWFLTSTLSFGLVGHPISLFDPLDGLPARGDGASTMPNESPAREVSVWLSNRATLRRTSHTLSPRLYWNRYAEPPAGPNVATQSSMGESRD